MKKIYYIITAILAIYTFNVIRDIDNNILLSKYNAGSKQIVSYSEKSILVDLSEDMQKKIIQINDLAIENNCMIQIYSKEDDKQIFYYGGVDELIFPLIPTHKKIDISFQNVDFYFTAIKSDTKGYSLDFLKSTNIEIRSIFEYADRESRTQRRISIYAEELSSVDSLISKIIKEYPDYVKDITQYDYMDVGWLQEAKLKRMTPLFMLFMLLETVTVLFSINHRTQEIEVRKLFGENDLAISMRLSLSTSIISLFIYYVTLFFLLFIQKIPYNQLTKDFYLSLAMTSLVLFAFNALLLGICYFFVKMTKINKQGVLKNKRLMESHVIMISVLLLFFVSMNYNTIIQGMSSANNLIQLTQFAEKHKDECYIAAQYEGTNANKKYDELYEILNNLGGYYASISNYSNAIRSNPMTTLVVNRNYLEKIPLSKLEKDTILTNPEGTILLSKRYHDDSDNEIQERIGRKARIIRLDSSLTLRDFNFFKKEAIVLKDPIIYILGDTEKFYFEPTIDMKIPKSYDEVKAVLSEKNLELNFPIEKIATEIDKSKEILCELVISALLNFLPFVITLSCILLEYAYISIGLKENEICTKNILGYHYFDVYKSVYTNLILAMVPATALILFQLHDSAVYSFFFLVSIILYHLLLLSLYIKKSERNRTLMWLRSKK